ncbi:hypothetical protein ACS0TY_007401 [Phlomoides rotata]
MEPKSNRCKVLLVLCLLTFLIFISFRNHYPNCSTSDFFSAVYKKIPSTAPTKSLQSNSPTNLSHLLFGLLGSVHTWYNRKDYIQSWWRPNVTLGLLYLDDVPPDHLLPWSPASPPYRVSDNLSFLHGKRALTPIMIRMVHGIMELMREMSHENLRWVVMGDDDSVFFVDNMVDVLSEYDHTKYYYLGGHSEDIISNAEFSFQQGFGGAGFMLSYPLARALADNMESCLRRYAETLNSADLITMVCIADLGVNLTPQQGIHQFDLHGDVSGFLSSHPKFPVLSLHHLDSVEPFFPKMDRNHSTRHLMKAAAGDQSRMLQQTICHHQSSNWSFSVSWGYSVHIYERIMPRFHLQKPIETFRPWIRKPKGMPKYMFNTRFPFNNDSCETPHVFFFHTLETASTWTLTKYTRAAPRDLPPCNNRAAYFVSEIRVYSPAANRKQMDRCECCDIVEINGSKAELKLRECMTGETIV